MESSAPLTTDASAQTPIDLSLSLQGSEFVAESPRVEVSLPVEAGNPAELTEAGIAFEPIGPNPDAAAVEEGDRLHYPSSDTDTDYILQPTEQGVEAMWQLRSVASPETLRLRYDLPVDATLQRRVGAGGANSVAIMQGERQIGRVTPVTARRLCR